MEVTNIYRRAGMRKLAQNRIWVICLSIKIYEIKRFFFLKNTTKFCEGDETLRDSNYIWWRTVFKYMYMSALTVLILFLTCLFQVDLEPNGRLHIILELCGGLTDGNRLLRIFIILGTVRVILCQINLNLTKIHNHRLWFCSQFAEILYLIKKTWTVFLCFLCQTVSAIRVVELWPFFKMLRPGT